MSETCGATGRLLQIFHAPTAQNEFLLWQEPLCHCVLNEKPNTHKVFGGEVSAGPTLWQVLGSDHRQLFTTASGTMTVAKKRAMTSPIKKAGGCPIPPTAPPPHLPTHCLPTAKAPRRCSYSRYTWFSSPEQSAPLNSHQQNKAKKPICFQVT